MSRTGGGVGTKGPGEKKLEIDKRRIRETIHDLKQELEKIRKTRITQREKRDIVRYTKNIFSWIYKRWKIYFKKSSCKYVYSR